MDFLQVLNLLVTGLASEAEEGPNQIHWWCWLASTRHNIPKRTFASQASIFCIYFSSLIFHTPAEKPIYSDHAIVFTAQTSKPVLFHPCFLISKDSVCNLPTRGSQKPPSTYWHAQNSHDCGQGEWDTAGQALQSHNFIPDSQLSTLSSCPQGTYSLSSQFMKMTNDHNHWGLNCLKSYKVKILPSRVVMGFFHQEHPHLFNKYLNNLYQEKGHKWNENPSVSWKFGSSNGKDSTVSLAPLQAAVLEEATFLWSKSIVSQIVSWRSVTSILTSCIPVYVLGPASSSALDIQMPQFSALLRTSC